MTKTCGNCGNWKEKEKKKKDICDDCIREIDNCACKDVCDGKKCPGFKQRTCGNCGHHAKHYETGKGRCFNNLTLDMTYDNHKAESFCSWIPIKQAENNRCENCANYDNGIFAETCKSCFATTELKSIPTRFKQRTCGNCGNHGVHIAGLGGHCKIRLTFYLDSNKVNKNCSWTSIKQPENEERLLVPVRWTKFGYLELPNGMSIAIVIPHINGEVQASELKNGRKRKTKYYPTFDEAKAAVEKALGIKKC